MRFMKRDLTSFNAFRAVPKKDRHGDVTNEYGDTSLIAFCGNIQPARENNKQLDAGISIKYDHVIYTPEMFDFQPLDRIFNGIRWYEIKTVKRWQSYQILNVEEVAKRE